MGTQTIVLVIIGASLGFRGFPCQFSLSFIWSFIHSGSYVKAAMLVSMSGFSKSYFGGVV